jgi:hypothetical protein
MSRRAEPGPPGLVAPGTPVALPGAVLTASFLPDVSKNARRPARLRLVPYLDLQASMRQ